MKPPDTPLVPRWFKRLKAPKRPVCGKCGEALSATPSGLVRWGCEQKDCPYS